MERIMYAVPKDPTSDCMDVLEEVTEMFKMKYPKISKEFRARKTIKNYSFELPI